MSKVPTCTACNKMMQAGFFLDKSDATGTAVQTCWHPGKAEGKKLMGMKTGGVKYDKNQMMAVTAYRCPGCGLVLGFAHKRS